MLIGGVKLNLSMRVVIFLAAILALAFAADCKNCPKDKKAAVKPTGNNKTAQQEKNIAAAKPEASNKKEATPKKGEAAKKEDASKSNTGTKAAAKKEGEEKKEATAADDTNAASMGSFSAAVLGLVGLAALTAF